MPRLQEVIHALELGAGAKYLRIAALFLGVLTMAVVYDLREYQNLRSEEAMDAAQVARNIAEGRGFTTRYVRPLSMAVIMNHRPDRAALVKDEHPDIVNAPLYPLVLAGFMKIPGLFDYEIRPPAEGLFQRHQPDVIVTLINQGFFFLSIALMWRLARRMFEVRVAVITVLVMLGSDLLWQFSTSGHSTMLALFLVTLLANVIYELDAGTQREPPISGWGTIGLAATAALLCGLLALTRYSFGWLILPLLVYLASGFTNRRVVLPLVASVVFLAVFTPWLVRNWQVCGSPFGLAAYSIVQETDEFAGNWLARTMEPDLSRKLSKVGASDIVRKAFDGGGRLLRHDLPELGGSWMTAFFLVGLLVPFVQRTRARLRWFTLGAVLVLGMAQVLARTHLSADVPRINSENLLVVMAPLVFMFGAALVVLLVYSLDLMVEAWRTVILGALVAVFWIPLLVTLGPPRTMPIAFPPYYPPQIQGVANYFQPGEWLMTDMPWAVAWYGDRQALLLTVTPDREFVDVSDWQKTVNGVFLTRLTLDQKFLSGWVENARKWGRFVIEILTRQQVPQGFPLQKAPYFLATFPHYLLLADRSDRWEGKLPVRPPVQPPPPEREDDSSETPEQQAEVIHGNR
jgi:hypothetical protein